MIRLSFIVCTYNGQERIETTLRYLIDACRSSSECEVLVIDNASTDSTSEIASKVLSDSGVEHQVLFEGTPGKANALKYGFTLAKGEYFSVVDDDNLIDKNWVETVINTLDSRPELGLVAPRIEGVFPDGEPPSEYYENVAWKSMLGVHDEHTTVVEGIYPFGAGMTGRTHVMNYLYQNVGTYLADRVGNKLTSGEDHEKSSMYKTLGWKSVYLPTLTLQHVIAGKRLNHAYIDRVFMSATKATCWLRILHSKKNSRKSIFVDLIIDFAHFIKFSLKAFFSKKEKTVGVLTKPPAFWRDLYLSKVSGKWELIVRHTDIETILDNLAQAPINVRAPSEDK